MVMPIDRPHKVELSTLEPDETIKAVMTSITSNTKKLRSMNPGSSGHRTAQRSAAALNGALDQFRAVQHDSLTDEG